MDEPGEELEAVHHPWPVVVHQIAVHRPWLRGFRPE
jgi:hypothetical protein